MDRLTKEVLVGAAVVFGFAVGLVFGMNGAIGYALGIGYMIYATRR